MADTILTPGEENVEQTTTESVNNYLIKDNYLSEFLTEAEKAVARENLGVYSKDSVYDKTESDTLRNQAINVALNNHLNTEDPHGILPSVQELLTGMVKDDGSTPFLAPLQGVDPIADFHLTTKRFVNLIIRDHLALDDPHKILPLVSDILELYVKLSQIYLKGLLYTKTEIDSQNTEFIRKDGTTPFTIALIGADPLIDSHLATKRYVDKVIYNHLTEVDPHSFISTLNSRLASYAKISNVYDKTQTYSRALVDSIVRSLVLDAATEVVNDHTAQIDPHNVMSLVRELNYVKQDGSTPFHAPQKGIDAVDAQDLITLHQVEEKIELVNTTINNLPEPVWRTSGPVETTVGFVEDNSLLLQELTLQEVCDAIFYGLGICMEVPEYVIVTEKCDVQLCIHGSTGTIQYAELWLNGELIYTLQREAFVDGCVTVDSKPLYEDAEFTFKVFYTTGALHEVTKTVKCYMPVFVGLLPKWKFGNVVTMDYLIELAKEDEAGTLNRFLNYGKGLTSFTFKYQFQDPNLRHPFVVLPADYPVLDTMVTKSLSFGIDAFDIIDMIPLAIEGVEGDVIYKMYIYKEALSSLNQEVTFNFKSE